MWLDLVRGSLVDDHVGSGKVEKCWRIMGPQLRDLLSGDVTRAELLNEGLKDVWVSSEVVAESAQAKRSIGGHSWRALVWATLSVLSTTGNELPLVTKNSKRAVPDWIFERIRVTLPFNPEIYQDPEVILLEIDVDRIVGVASPEGLRDVLHEQPDLVSGRMERSYSEHTSACSWWISSSMRSHSSLLRWCLRT